MYGGLAEGAVRSQWTGDLGWFARGWWQVKVEVGSSGIRVWFLLPRSLRANIHPGDRVFVHTDFNNHSTVLQSKRRLQAT